MKTNDADQFQFWLAHMDDAIADFMLKLPETIAQKLNGSVESIDVLERWLLSHLTDAASIQRPEVTLLLDGAARYVGEVLRKASGAQWFIELKDKKRVFFGLPVLKGGSIGSMVECPLTLITASLDRRTGTYMSSVVRNLSEAH